MLLSVVVVKISWGGLSLGHMSDASGWLSGSLVSVGWLSGAPGLQCCFPLKLLKHFGIDSLIDLLLFFYPRTKLIIVWLVLLHVLTPEMEQELFNTTICTDKYVGASGPAEEEGGCSDKGGVSAWQAGAVLCLLWSAFSDWASAAKPHCQSSSLFAISTLTVF